MHVIGTAGHVDHGKSTLVEALTGIDPDRFAEEKERGLTIDLGFAWVELPSGREVGIVDVPGHERFIKNMLAGAGGVNVCLFVVAANEGWKPQSAEHLGIVDILGITGGVVALTKADVVDAATLERVRADVVERISQTSLAGAEVVACSATTGTGMDELRAALDRALAATPPAPDEGRARLWVDRVFTIAGAGTVVTGTLAGGSFATGDVVDLLPERRKARIRSIQSHKKDAGSIGPGNRAALNLAGLERQGAQRGDAVVHPDRFVVTRRVDALVRVLPATIAGSSHELTERGAHLLYAGSAETPVRIRLLDAERVRPGESSFAQLNLRDPLALRRGDRFVLRDAGRVLTFGGGEILDPLAPAARRGDIERVALLDSLVGAEPGVALAALVGAAGTIARSEALLRAGADGPGVGVVALGPLLAGSGEVARLHEVVRAAVSSYHQDHPLERGMARESLRAAIALDAAAFDALIASIDDVVEDGAVVRLADHSVRLAPEQETARAALVSELDEAGFTPPPAQDLHADPALLRALVDAGELVKIGDFYLTGARAAQARASVRAHIESVGPMTVAQIRDLLGTTRKYAVPLCEWLDATGATRRQGDLRALGPTP